MSGRSGRAFGLFQPAASGACPCGGWPEPGLPYVVCCGRLHAGAAVAATAEELMRSRYAAFAVGDADYLLRTWHSRTRPEGLTLNPEHSWTGLEVLDCRDGGAMDEDGTVTYRARSRGHDGAAHVLVEVSRFAKRGGRWLYVDGDVDPASS